VIVLLGVTEILDIVHRVRLKPIKMEGKGMPPSSGVSGNGGNSYNGESFRKTWSQCLNFRLLWPHAIVRKKVRATVSQLRTMLICGGRY